MTDELLRAYVAAVVANDKLGADAEQHDMLLAAGLVGEAGSLLTELKKTARERQSYPWFAERLIEEAGDFLWYLTRLSTRLAPVLVDCSEMRAVLHPRANDATVARPYLRLAHLASSLAECLESRRGDYLRPLAHLWQYFGALLLAEGIDPAEVLKANLRKSTAIYSPGTAYHPLFDEDFEAEEQLPRQMTIDFLERRKDDRVYVIMRSANLNIGDRLTDNAESADAYRYHDAFHLAYAVHLGWSPVIRKLLNCKRKSVRRVDENQDGARAIITEEAVSAIVFQRAKTLQYFDGLSYVSYSLLKLIREFVVDFEVRDVPSWQWERAILDGFRLFRELRDNQGGRVSLTMTAHERSLTYVRPSR